MVASAHGHDIFVSLILVYESNIMLLILLISFVNFPIYPSYSLDEDPKLNLHILVVVVSLILCALSFYLRWARW